MTAGDLGPDIEAIFRAEAGRAHAAVTATVGDLGLAEDAVQEAFAEALAAWPARGLPDNPGAWITTTARRRAIDRLRREGRRAEKEEAAVRERSDDGPEPTHGLPDDQLRLLFTCCHPALAAEAQVALTLRLVGGLRTPEIARAFLVPEATVAQRLVRAKAKVRAAGIPFRVPPPHLLPERLPYVLLCTYLVFTEGYASTGGAHIRSDLCAEAIRLARLAVELMPDEPEARGLLALLLLQDSRRAARVDDRGALVVLEDQDRSRWDQALIDEGRSALATALRRGRVGPYQLQAAIAEVHAAAPTFAATDWPTMVARYDELLELTRSPVVALNRAVAVSYAEGPAPALALLDALQDEPRLQRDHHLSAVRADVLRRSDRPVEAATAYREAVALAPPGVEADHLRRRLAELDGPPPADGTASGGR